MYDDWSSNRSACVGFLYIVVRGLLLSRVTKQSRKGILPFSSISLVNCMSAFVVRPLMILFIFLLSHQFQLKYCLICSVGSYSLRLLDVLIANLHGRPLKGKMRRKVARKKYTLYFLAPINFPGQFPTIQTPVTCTQATNHVKPPINGLYK